MPITDTFDQIPRRRTAGASRWERLLSFFGENSISTRSAGVRIAADGIFARAAVADACDPVLFAACLEAERWLTETPAADRAYPPTRPADRHDTIAPSRDPPAPKMISRRTF